MKPELRARIVAFNKVAKARKDKSDDLDAIVAAFAKLPHGQLKKLLTDDVIAVLGKYGISEG